MVTDVSSPEPSRESSRPGGSSQKHSSPTPLDSESHSSEPPPHEPRLLLDEEGTILELNRAAKQRLQHSSEAPPTRCFFSYVHGDNLPKVMRDLARIIARHKERSRWLLRLRTGSGRPRWYRAEAQSRHRRSEGAVLVRFRPLRQDW